MAMTQAWRSKLFSIISLTTTVLAVGWMGNVWADHHGNPNPDSIEKIASSDFGIDQSEIDNIKAQMQKAVDGDFIPGALILVGNSEGVGVLESVGTQAKGDSTPIDEQTIFRIYSMTKPIVSVATMTMVEDGLIALDDPVSKFFPDFADLEVIDMKNGDIQKSPTQMTVQHLLTHEAGIIQEFFSPNSPLGQLYGTNIPKGDITNQELAAAISKLPAAFEPGTSWHYGHSTDVLGAVLEVAAGKTLGVILQERIFAPLGMDETTFFVPSIKSDRIAQPIHGAMTDNTVLRKMLSGGGGLNSTTEDYVRFAQMLLNGGEYRGHRIIEESTLDQMRQPLISEDVSREYFFFGNQGNWGLGFHLQPTDGSNPAGPHNFGWRGIGGTLFIVDEENDFYMMYMEQRRGGPQGAPFDNNAAQRVVYEAMRN